MRYAHLVNYACIAKKLKKKRIESATAYTELLFEMLLRLFICFEYHQILIYCRERKKVCEILVFIVHKIFCLRKREIMSYYALK